MMSTRQSLPKICRGLALLDLPDGGPIRPDAGEAGERPGVVEREPDVAALSFVELAEGVERHHATVLDAEPTRPMFALHVADVGRPAIRLHPEQLFELDGLALGPLFGPFLGGIHQCLRRRWHAPPRPGE